jgi:hypothetical protein
LSVVAGSLRRALRRSPGELGNGPRCALALRDGGQELLLHHVHHGGCLAREVRVEALFGVGVLAL